MKILLVSSTGGHFNALQQLRSFWSQHECIWVTFDTESTRIALQNQSVYWAFSPTNRHLLNLMRNFLLAWQVIKFERPQLILSTGAGVAVPFIILGKLFRCKTVFIESYTRIKELSLSARLVLPFLDKLYVQWPSLKTKYPQAEFLSDFCRKVTH
ncbi:PssD/Cps14F family polysaccharide biosynthesis glycosyltransferase [Gloeothece verrucosa]|uniref:Oligosaccharide biosynthesis protein Alg14 like protein n=1 Tax=Gloeothece verrucosa (strain PCC 7822) TaxID=497965 RepID=E0UD48_GLOV7|nr:PssD/Cps14F family polysaccharide biosynthesis glycosyltransferase [Gloeothece verrucosa]ADN12928.1 Oligosaccharide biosynthesis protein Alg14 like protein [Gloeothece verrucosa PCC 7822]